MSKEKGPLDELSEEERNEVANVLALQAGVPKMPDATVNEIQKKLREKLRKPRTGNSPNFTNS